MKRPVLTALIAVAVVLLGLLIAGTMTSGETRIEKTAVLSGPPERVWPFFAQLQNWPQWYRAEDGTRMTYSALTQGTASGLNAVRLAEESFGTRWEEKVTAFEVNKRIELTGTNTFGRDGWRQDIVLTPEGADKTKVTWTLEYQVSGPFLKLINKARNEEQFGRYIEGGLKNIDPLIPSAEEWGPPTRPAATLTTPAAPAPSEPAAAPAGEAAAPAGEAAPPAGGSASTASGSH